MSFIKLNQVAKFYDKRGQNPVFSEVDLEIATGEFVMLKGVSGAGKSTLLNIIGGIEPATRGSIVIDGTDIGTLRGKRRAEFYRHEVGFIFQGFYLQPQLTVQENITLAGTFAKLPRNERRARAEELAKKLGIEQVLNLKPAEISGGQAERTAVARAMFMRPKIILADEPTNNLDPENARGVIDLLKLAQKELKATVIVASHDAVVEQYATRIVEIKGGKVLA